MTFDQFARPRRLRVNRKRIYEFQAPGVLPAGREFLRVASSNADSWILYRTACIVKTHEMLFASQKCTDNQHDGSTRKKGALKLNAEHSKVCEKAGQPPLVEPVSV
jgi:hypothetical protein